MTPIAIPVEVTVVVKGTAQVALAVSTPALQFPSCTSPLRVVASVTATNSTAPPNGTVTLSIVGLSFPASGSSPLNVTLALVRISFDMRPLQSSHVA